MHLPTRYSRFCHLLFFPRCPEVTPVRPRSGPGESDPEFLHGAPTSLLNTHPRRRPPLTSFRRHFRRTASLEVNGGRMCRVGSSSHTSSPPRRLGAARRFFSAGALRKTGMNNLSFLLSLLYAAQGFRDVSGHQNPSMASRRRLRAHYFIVERATTLPPPYSVNQLVKGKG